MSKFILNDYSKLLPTPFSTHKKIKLNLGNNEIGSKGVDYILSLIPNGVEDLELYFDTIQADDNLGGIMARRLNAITSLKKLKISLILCGTKE